MLSSFHFDHLHHLMEKSLERFPSAALVTTDGELLLSRYQNLADIGTLPQAALTCHQFFQLKTDDVVIINDPYSGGSLLSSVNLVAGISSDLLLVARIPFKPRVVLANSVESEGVRIPPTPLVNHGELNEEILKQICAHPLAPPHFEVGLRRALDGIQETQLELNRVKTITGLALTRRLMKDWLTLAEKRFHALLGELAEGDARMDISLSPRSKLSLQIEIHDHRVAFNFAGSGAPDRYALSDAATLGACVGALAAALNCELPINSGILRSVDVVAPLGSVVHAKYPAPVFLGFTDGTALVAGAVLKLLGQIDPKLQMGQGGLSQCSLEIDFGQGSYFYDDVEPGSAATRDRRGADALDLWRRTHLQRSIENIERLYPLRVRAIALRSQSGGSGQFGGGQGLTKVYEVLAPGRLRWLLSRNILKPEGAQGGKTAIGPEILVKRAGGESEDLADAGELQLSAGDQVIVHSAGGGGFGAP